MPRDRRLSVGLGYRSRWGSDFEREPLHVYTEKERERAKELIQQAARQKYGTDMPPVPRVQRTAGVTDGGQAFEGRAMAAPSQKTAPKPKEDKKGGGGLWGRSRRSAGMCWTPCRLLRRRARRRWRKRGTASKRRCGRFASSTRCTVCRTSCRVVRWKSLSNASTRSGAAD